jgi:hypothetical protein
MNDPHDSELSRIYKEGAWPEPSRQIDEAILSASRRAARARHPLVWRWAPPLALAATVVLTFTLVLRVYEERPEERIASPALPIAPSVPGAEKRAAPAAKEEKTAAPLRAASAPQSAPVSAQAAPPLALKKQAPEAARADRAQSRLERVREAAPPPQGRQAETQIQPLSAPLHSSEPPSPVTPQPAATTSAPVVSGGAANEAATGGIVIRRSDSPERTPQTWLDDIRKLKAQGRTEEAGRELAEFRKRYPDYGLPDDLR